MFKYRVILAVLGAASVVVPAFANTVIVTSPSGVFTSSGTPAYDTWYANNVRTASSVGITSTYADSGNGSLQFTGGAYASKADFEYDFSAGNAFSLSSLTELSYDVYRDSSSTVASDLEPAFRLSISDSSGKYLGSLVYEGVYNNQAPPTAGFETENILNDYFWATSSLLPNNINSGTPSFHTTLAQWNASVAGGIIVTGFTTGIGSGWSGGSFDGAVDNISYATNGGPATDFNFEVASPVPEPSSVTLVGVGMLAIATLWMRRRNEATIL